MPLRRPVQRVTILGAGLSGLSLALRLLEHDGRPEIVLVDRREDFTRDRTWCAWETGAWTMGGVARHRWTAWRVRAGGRDAVHRGARVPYACWSSADVHAAGLARLERAGGVTLRLGERVTAIDPATAAVTTDAGTIEADLAVDALAASSPLAVPRAGRDTGLVQSFLGLEVETEHAVFDPGVVDLMDFDALGAPRPDMARFLYVLPFSPTRALVEDTSLGATAIPAAVRAAALARHLETIGAGTWRTVHEERGALPMTTDGADGGTATARRGRRCWTAGRAAGALRPSSGYALARIERHAERMAHAIVAGHPAPPRAGGVRGRALDAVLLRALRDDPSAAPDWFRGLVERTPPDAFARFMSDAGSIRDESRMVVAAPGVRFAAAAGALALRR